VGLKPTEKKQKTFVAKERNFTDEELNTSYNYYNEELRTTSLVHETFGVLENFNPNLFNNTDEGGIPDEALDEYEGYHRDIWL